MQTPHASFDQGAWVSSAGLHKLKKNFEDGNVDVNLVLTARPGLKPAAVVTSRSDSRLGPYHVTPTADTKSTVHASVRIMP